MQEQDVTNFGAYPAMVKEVITNPVGFFREMPRSGGFVHPLLFMVILGVVSGLISMILGLVGLGAPGVFSGVTGIILIPIAVAVFGFVVAAILFVVWKIMGSQESFEAAYRCLAYTAAIMPITTLLGGIPYLGGVIGIIWSSYLLIVASTEVHAVKSKIAWAAFGGLALLMVLSSLSMEFAAHRMTSGLENWRQQSNVDQLQDLDKMSPEEAGKAVGQFLKGFGKSVDEK